MNVSDTAKGSIKEVTIDSKYLTSAERILIYTPARYSPLYSYSVLYVQDGDDYLSLGRLVSLLDELTADKKIADIIAVFLPVEKERRYHRYHPDGSEHQLYKRFLAEEVVPYVDTHYSTNPLGGGRTLLGESLGGVVSLFTALTYPHTFGQVASQSGAFDEAMYPVIQAEPMLDQLSVYMEIGTQEDVVETPRGTFNLLKSNLQMKEILEKKGATLSFHTFEGDHTWGYWQTNLPRLISYFFS